MGRIKEIIQDLILHLSIWVKEPVYKPVIHEVNKPIKEWREKHKIIVVDNVKIEDTVVYPTSRVSIPMWSTGVMSTCSSLITSVCYPEYFKDYLNETTSNPK